MNAFSRLAAALMVTVGLGWAGTGVGSAVAGEIPANPEPAGERERCRHLGSAMAPEVPAEPDPVGGLMQIRDVSEPKRFMVVSGLFEEEPPASPRVGGETCVDATVIASLPYTDSSTTAGRAHNYDAGGAGVFTCPYTSSARDVVYKYTPTANQVLNITTVCGGTGTLDSKIYVYGTATGTPPANACITANLKQCDDDFCGSPSWHSTIQALQVYTGNTYYVVVDGWGSSSGTYTLQVTTLGPGSCCDATVQPDLCNNNVQFLDCAGLGWKWVENGVCGTPPPPNSDDCYLTPVPPADQDVTCPPSYVWGPGWDETPGSYSLLGADAGWPAERVDGFWELQRVKFVSWWGVYTIPWTTPCDKADVWNVTFYNDDGTGKPGTVAYGPYTLTPQRTGTGWSFSITSEIFRFTAELPVVVSMTEGWVGFQAQTDPANPNCYGAILDSGENIYADQLHYALEAPATLTKQNDDLPICLSGG